MGWRVDKPSQCPARIAESAMSAACVDRRNCTAEGRTDGGPSVRAGTVLALMARCEAETTLPRVQPTAQRCQRSARSGASLRRSRRQLRHDGGLLGNRPENRGVRTIWKDTSGVRRPAADAPRHGPVLPAWARILPRQSRNDAAVLPGVSSRSNFRDSVSEIGRRRADRSSRDAGSRESCQGIPPLVVTLCASRAPQPLAGRDALLP